MARRPAARARAPRQVLQALRDDLRRGLPPGLVVLTGDDLYHLDTAQRELVEALVPREASDFALTVFGEEKVPIPTIVAACRSRGMFSTRRVVLVREIEAMEGEPQALSDYAENPPEDSYLVVRAPALDRRRKLHKILATAGRLLNFKADAGGLLSDVARLAADAGLKLQRDAATLLAQACAGDLYRVAGELEKIRAWLGDDHDDPVNVETVRQVAAGSGLLSGWEVADAVLERDRGRALSAARKVVEAGEPPIRIVGGLAWRARTMIQAKALLESGRSRQDVVRVARAWAYEQELFRGLARYSLAELLAFPAKLIAADRALKSRSLDPRAVLEGLVSDLIDGGRTATWT